MRAAQASREMMKNEAAYSQLQTGFEGKARIYDNLNT